MYARDLQATYQGAVFLLFGLLGLVGIVIAETPTARATQIGTFIAWMVAFAGLAGGFALARSGLRRRTYGRHAIVRGLVTLVASILLFGTSYVALAIAGIAPLPALGADVEKLDIPADALAAPSGWAKDGPTSFTRGAGTAVMTAEIGALDVGSADIEAGEWRRGLLDGMRRDPAFAAVQLQSTAEQPPIGSRPVVRATITARLDASPLIWDVYSVHDPATGIDWSVSFAKLPPRAPEALQAQRAFLQHLDYDALA